MGRYYTELTRAMDMLAADPRTVFIGQAVGYPGTGITNTLANVPKDRLICIKSRDGATAKLILIKAAAPK